MRRLFYLLFLLIIAYNNGINAQQDTVFYSFYITNPCNGNTHQFNDGHFLEGQSFEIEAQDLTELDTALAVYQDLYDALVGSTFGLEDGALDVDIEIGIWLLQLECGSDTIVDPTGRGIPHFLFWGVVVKEEGDTTVYGFDDFYEFKNGKKALLKIPSTTNFMNYLVARGIELDSLAFVYYLGDSVVTAGISWTQIPFGSSNPDTTIVSLSHFSKFGGGKGTLNSAATDVKEIELPDIPDKFKLFQNYPNPFNPSTSIRYALPKDGEVELIVYNSLGVEIAVLADGFKHKGTYEVKFDPADLASGIYFYQLKFDNNISTRKMIYIK